MLFCISMDGTAQIVCAFFMPKCEPNDEGATKAKSRKWAASHTLFHGW